MPSLTRNDATSGEGVVFENVSKIYKGRNLQKQVYADLNFALSRGDRLAVCGANGAGKSTLMRLLAGVEAPTTGTIRRSISTSWPIGHASCFMPQMTGADNVRFLARIYGKPEREMLDRVESFAELGNYLDQPVRSYSAGMTARLAFGASLCVDFDCYLIDEVTSVGDARFRAKCENELMARRETSALVMTSHDPHTLEQYCERGAVVYGGSLVFYDSVAEACHVHHALQMRSN